jgi:hypothetical protein
MAVGRLSESGKDLCSAGEPAGATALKRMMAAMVELFCDSFDQVPGASSLRSSLGMYCFP